MICDSRASLLARTFASPCFGCEPKATDAPPSSLMDSITSPKVKKTKGEGVGACWSSEMGTKKIDKQFNYSHMPTQTKQQVG